MLVHILKNIDGVHEKRGFEHQVGSCQCLILMHTLGVAPRIRYVGDKTEMIPSRTEGLVKQLLDQDPGLDRGRVVRHTLHKDFTLINQCPDMLLSFTEISNAQFPFCRGLLTDPLMQNPVLLDRGGFLNQAIAPLVKICA